MSRRGRIVGILLSLPLAVSCASILGIDEAKLDPSLSGGGVDSGSESDGAPPASALCKKYCDTVMKNCSGAGVQQYPDEGVCLSVCRLFPEGNASDTQTNTIQCRLHFAESAALVGEQQVNCSAAGPAGNGVCGSNCQSLCAMAIPVCSGTFAGATACDTACRKLPDQGNFDITMASGPSVQCRIYHATAAATRDTALHCKHVSGDAPCARLP